MTTDLSFLKNWEPDLINSREWLNQYTVGIANNRLIRFDQKEQLDKSSKEREALSQWKDRATKIMQLRKDTFQYENIPIISAAQHTYDDEYSTEYENAEPFYQNILNISSEDELNLKPLLKEELKVFVLDQHVNGRLLTNISFSPRMHLFDLRNFTTDEEGAKLLMIAIQKVHAIEKLYLTNFIKTKTFDEEGQYFNSFVDNIPASVWKNLDTLYIDGHSLFFCVEKITGKMKNSNVQRLETTGLSTEQFKFFADLPKLHTWVISSTRADLNVLVEEVLKPNWPTVDVNAFRKWFKPEEIASWNDTLQIPPSDPSPPHTSFGDSLIEQSTFKNSLTRSQLPSFDHLKLFYANKFLVKPGLSDMLLGIKVALLDTGVDYLHTDLNHAVIKGKTFVPNENWFVDSNGHGTHCAGIIAGKDSGLAPGVQLYIAKVLNSRGEGDVAWLEDGLKWAIEQKVNIISLSLSSKKHNNRIYQLIMKAIGAGILVICAAGNAGGWNRFNITFPATIDSCIRVASVNSFGRISEYSSVGGPQIDVAALGEGVWSTWPGNEYRKKDGTSMAAPMISGLCALLLAYDKVCHEDDPKLLNAHCMKDLFRNLAFNVTQEIGKGGGILQLENILEIPDLFKKYLRDVV